MKIIHLSIFLGSPKNHGGTKRSSQIAEILAEDNIESLSINQKQIFSKTEIIKNIYLFINIKLFAFYLFLFKGLSIKGLFKFILETFGIFIRIKPIKFSKILIETGPGVSIPLMHYLQYKKISYIAIPHNIECMVPGQMPLYFRTKKQLFDCEITGLKKAERCFAISKFDRAILSSFEINTELLPYFPSQNDLQKLDLIKSKRAAYQKNHSTLFLMGSVTNPPTFNGFKSFIQEFSKQDTEFKLVVAGYGTEIFSEFQSDKIKILGPLSDSEIEEQLASCKAVIINQPQTTGFLTKIIELNLCNVPMLVTSDYFQAEALENYGVFKIENLKEFKLQKITLKINKHFSKPILNL